MSTDASSPGRRLAGGLLLWFAVLGGALAWALHEIAAWGTDELVCANRTERVAGAPLSLVLTLMVVIPLAVAVAALVTACVAWRRLASAQRRAEPDGETDRRLSRAGMMAMVGLVSDILFVAIIVFGGAGVLVFPPCQS
jgi:hypothetical protein